MRNNHSNQNKSNTNNNNISHSITSFLQNKKNINKKNIGQGTIEYLVIIAIIIIIGLIITGTATGLFDQTQVINTSEQIIGQIGSSGISINSAISDYEGDGLLNLKNTTGETINLNKITIEQGENNYNKQWIQGNTELIQTENLCTCKTGQTKKTCNFTFEYTTRHGLEKKTTQTITVECSENFEPTKTPVQPIQEETFYLEFNNLTTIPSTYIYTTNEQTIPKNSTLYMELELENNPRKIEWIKNNNATTAWEKDIMQEAIFHNQTFEFEENDVLKFRITQSAIMGMFNRAKGTVTIKLNNENGPIVAEFEFDLAAYGAL
jgi:hypothetical protein